MSDWQTIETAPKDGTRILVIAQHASGPSIVKWWHSYCDIQGFGRPPDYFVTDITYWQPLPSPSSIEAHPSTAHGNPVEQV